MRASLLLLALTVCASAEAQTPVQARPADAFAESVGVNVHFDYTDTAYFLRLAEARQALCDLGVRHIRQGVDQDPVKRAAILSVVQACGVRLLVGLGPRTGPWPAPLDLRPAATQATLDAARGFTFADGASAIDAFEGPNEYDAAHGSDRNWTATLAQYQRMAYGLVKSDPDFADRPVYGPPLAYYQSAPQLPDLSRAMDALNMHPYPGGGPPGPAFYQNLLAYRAWAPSVSAAVATETGYHNALGDGSAPGGYIGQPGVPEAAEARYLPRLFFEAFRQGVARTFTYELVDLFPDAAGNNQERHFGLVRNDLTRKPAFEALQRTLALFADAGPAFAPGALAFSLDGAPGTVHHVLLQTRDGRFWVVVWREVPSYETPPGWQTGEVGQMITYLPTPVTLRLGEAPQRVALYRPSHSMDPTEVAPSTAIALDVLDEVLAVEITPRGATAAEAPPASGALLRLGAVAPNPAHAGASVAFTSVAFALAEPALVTTEVFDALGRLVYSDRRAASAGAQRARVGVAALPAGVYVVRLSASAAGRVETATGRLTVR